MALRTLGTTSTTILTALGAWSESLSDADIAAISQSIVGDGQFASILSGASAGATAVLATGSTHTNTTLDTLVSTGGAALASIMPTDVVLGAGVPAGTFVQAVSGTTVTLSKAATASASIRVAFVRMTTRDWLNRRGQLTIPGRGTLNLRPGDILAVDNTGWPIVLSGNSQGYAGSFWNLV